MYPKYKYWSSTHFFKKYLSTSSTFISSTSTSTSTHIKICSKVQDGHTEQSKFWMDKTKGLFPNHVFVQKSRWPYSMQSKFGMDKIQGNYKLVWLYDYMASRYIFTSSKKVMDYL